MKETLNQKELDNLESDDENYNKKTINRRKDAIPNEILIDSKKLHGGNYKPKQTMNYLNGLKMLIKESSKKKWCKKIKKNKNLNIMWYGGNGNKLEIEN